MTLRSKPSAAVQPELSRTHATATPSAPIPPKESDADARLRDRDLDRSSWPTKNEIPAMGGRRRVGGSGRLRKREWYILGAVCCVAAVVRLWKLSHPSSVVFDEVHFGGFAAKYIRRKFFMDVHPPLAKLLITLSAFIGGFNGQFDFKDIGKDYLEDKVPYTMMRLFPAVLGLALVPLTFLTLITLRLSLATALLGSLLITFENALITQSRLILLDSYLVFFTALTVYFWAKFYNLDSEGRAFTEGWWRWLTLTGLSLGAVVSCKWVGLFTIAAVGAGTLRQLWLLLGNLKVTPRMWIKHFMARALCLIVVPIIFYMAMFRIHFWILNMSGEGDGFMSSEFQHTLEGHGMEDTFADVGLGSIVSIRHVNTQGGYLHSHPYAYPGGSQQQQITLYPHRDDNNNWRVTNGSGIDQPASYPWETLPFEHVIAGSKIRLEHVSTQKRLHSHDFRPPVSEVDFQNEVSGYGFPGFAGDANDDFVVEIAPKTKGGRWDWAAKHRLRTLRTQFRLRHALSGCYLFSHKTKLPEWGFEQQEVTCNKNPTWDNSLWYIETNTHPQLPFDAEKVNYQRPSFFEKFFELQAVMWRTNAGLTDRHAYDSRPQSWPWMRRGINFWVKDNTQVYLIGNPVVWWLSFASIAVYLGIRVLLVLREKRGYRDLYKPRIAFYDEVCGFLVIGWALHFLPFFLMQRQLFLHHYLPSLYFAVLCFCAVFDFVLSSVRPRVKLQVGAVILVLTIWAFAHFSPLIYAGQWTKGMCEKAKWLKSWDFACNDFPDRLSHYSGQMASEKIAPSGGVSSFIDSAITNTLVEEAPEPIKNVFDNPDGPAEEKTIAVVGPEPNVPMLESTETRPMPVAEETQDAAPLEDTRAPVGMDAGAPQVTAAAEDEGGWHGDAEDDGKRVGGEEVLLPGEGKVEQAPIGAKVDSVPELELDDEAKKLVEEAMKAQGEI
ncbi:putative Dolichyl-phosphate-mannose--protein mannosyltransferase 2 [Dioszegia hungarica]|uniref:Dolichyl-phosphate-mannose--protein mannosyltransferase n=1 Tax=Dioszegia hungarica TaxID=4972 RepID=A0AA38H0Q3_9TREE|nr:putative Dolichyl-phosphate-mannose--protein mannosyltransferase 2 [Dioszegia hungarica]KAI9631780.1 putative Dolichyl-phosphate-mannose--protein mannosyltransferase 2 [Dioszegia hungarica]